MSGPGDVVEAEAFAAEIESGRFRVLVEVRCLAAFDLVATIHATPQGDALRIAPFTVTKRFFYGDRFNEDLPEPPRLKVPAEAYLLVGQERGYWAGCKPHGTVSLGTSWAMRQAALARQNGPKLVAHPVSRIL